MEALRHFLSYRRRTIAAVAGSVLAVVAVAWVLLRPAANEEAAASKRSAPQASALSLKGRVTSNDALPIEAAMVCARGATASSQLSRHCVTTDVHGDFKLLLMPGAYSVTASADHHSSATSNVAVERSQAEALDFSLSREPATLAGKVSSAAGADLANARIEVYQGTVLVSNVQTNSRGEFAVWTPEGSFAVRAEAEGFAPTTVQTTAPTSDVDITLYPGNVVTGQVLLRDSMRPAAGIQVSAIGRRDGIASPLRDAAVLTDEQGRFRFAALAPGSWAVSVTDKKVWGATPEPIAVRPGEEIRDITLLVEPAMEVTGHFVIGNNAQPCATGRLQLIPEAMFKQANTAREALATNETELGTSAIPVFTAQVGPGGEVRFDAVPYGTYRAGPLCDEHQFKEGPNVIVVSAEPQNELRWKFDGGLGIKVGVVDEMGQPIESVVVGLSLRNFESQPRARVALNSRSGSTDNTGHCSFGGLRAGEYRVSAQYSNASGGVIATQDVDIVAGGPSQAVTLTLPGGSEIRIRARTKSGDAVSRMLFFASERGGTRYEARYRGAGRFEIGPLPHGEYRVFAYDNLNEKIPLNNGQVLAIRGSGSIDMEFTYEQPRGTIQGSVVDSSGTPQVGVLVRAVSATLDESDALYSSIQTSLHGAQEKMTDQRGRFQIAGINSEGVYDLYVDHSSGLSETRRGISSGSVVEIVLPTGAALIGSVVDHKGQRVKKFDVVIRDLERGNTRAHSFSKADGRFKIDNVYPGNTNVAVYSDDGELSATRETIVGAQQVLDLGELVIGIVAGEGAIENR